MLEHSINNNESVNVSSLLETQSCENLLFYDNGIVNNTPSSFPAENNSNVSKVMHYLLMQCNKSTFRLLIVCILLSITTNTLASKQTNSGIVEFKNERESWTNQSDRYSNFEYGFAWDFENHYGFEKVFSLEKHTIFRAEAKSGDLVAFVNIQKNVTQVTDSWNAFDVIKNNFHLVAEYTYDATGEKIEINNISKCSIAGQHAIKVEYTSIKVVDDVFKYEVITQVTNYMIYNKDEFVIVSVKAREDVCNKDEINNIFKGFTFIVRQTI